MPFLILAVFPLRAQETKLESAEPVFNRPHPTHSQNVDEPSLISASQFLAQQKKKEQKMQRILKDLEKEPSVDRLIAEALSVADAGGARSTMWQKSVRRAPILPRLKVSVGVDLERDESLDRYQDDPDRWGADTDRDFGIQLTAQWELPDLIYNPDELKVYNTLSNRAERREAVISMIIGYYFERRRLQILAAMASEATLESKIERSIRLKELTAIIDALTGGALTRNL